MRFEIENKDCSENRAHSSTTAVAQAARRKMRNKAILLNIEQQKKNRKISEEKYKKKELPRAQGTLQTVHCTWKTLYQLVGSRLTCSGFSNLLKNTSPNFNQ